MAEYPEGEVFCLGDNPSPFVRGNSMFYSTLFLSGGTIALRIVQMGFHV